jgi:hypothetical protein
MDIGGVHVPSLLTSSAAFGAVWGTFAKFDRMQSRTNRRFVGRWLLSLKGPERNWNAFFAELFTKFFGRVHLSWKCVFRSITLTLILVGALFVFSFGSVGIFPPLLMAVPVFSATFINDYVSLGKTRFLLTRIGTTDKLGVMVGVVVVDFLATTILYLFFMIIFFVLFIILPPIISGEEKITSIGQIKFLVGLSTIQGQTWFDAFFDTGYKTTDPFAASFYRRLYEIALLTSAWLWVYIIAAQLLRVIRFMPRFFRWYSKIADLQEHPVRAIGFVAGVLSFVIVGLWNAVF